MLEFVKIKDLEELKCILDTLVFEEYEEPSIFTEEYAVELVETALHLMDEYMQCNPHTISEPNFHEILLEDIKDIFYAQFEEHIDDIDNGDDIEDDMNELLEDAFNIFITTFYPERSINEKQDNIFKNDTIDINEIEEKIDLLRNIIQPVQRTPEWYAFRWNLITASNAYKALDSQASINQLIYEKCQPLKTYEENDSEIKMVNTNTAMHWGQKYEPLSVMIYEDMYKSQVEDFGCIQHQVYKFLGASPDGIIIKSETGRYGRMLEIKNPVSREITGIPKKEYWVQMQLQMEVCDLDECDFLETKFVEYPDYTSYKNDVTSNNMHKGTIIYFHKKDGTPFYVYQPLNLKLDDEISKWEDEMLEKYQSEQYDYIFLKFIYWKLDKLSCVLVLRNHEWFKNNIGQIEKVWKIIEEERVTGYEHRAPNKKLKKDTGLKPFINNESSGCLLNFTKIIKLDTTNNNV
jgi:putative phage-type endonuclease